MNTTTPRRSLLAAIPLTLLTPPAIIDFALDAAVQADELLHAMIEEYNTIFAADLARGDSTADSLGRRIDLLGQITDFEPVTLHGALAKMRLGFDDAEIEAQIWGAAPLEQVAFTAIRDLFRVTGTA